MLGEMEQAAVLYPLVRGCVERTGVVTSIHMASCTNASLGWRLPRARGGRRPRRTSPPPSSRRRRFPPPGAGSHAAVPRPIPHRARRGGRPRPSAHSPRAGGRRLSSMGMPRHEAMARQLSEGGAVTTTDVTEDIVTDVEGSTALHATRCDTEARTGPRSTRGTAISNRCPAGEATVPAPPEAAPPRPARCPSSPSARARTPR